MYGGIHYLQNNFQSWYIIWVWMSPQTTWWVHSNGGYGLRVKGHSIKPRKACCTVAINILVICGRFWICFTMRPCNRSILFHQHHSVKLVSVILLDSIYVSHCHPQSIKKPQPHFSSFHPPTIASHYAGMYCPTFTSDPIQLAFCF
jgi:hypothetical protein